MDSQKSFGTLHLLFAMQFMVLTLALDLHRMSIEDYVNYINPPAVHKYQHENGDTILCVKYEDQISLNSDKTYGQNKKDLRKSWMDGNLSSSLRKECPEGTVHVREIKHEHVKRAGSVARFIGIKNDDAGDSYETKAVIGNYDHYGVGKIRKARGVMNVWQPYLAPGDLLSRGVMKIGVETDDGRPIQMIEAGWQVADNAVAGDSKPRFFVRWTADGFDKTGCLDLMCSGFVMAKYAPLYPGQPFTNVSLYGEPDQQVNLDIVIELRSRSPPAWVVLVGSKEVGQLPAKLVPDIRPKINTVKWGGEVWVVGGGPPSKTDMGSGTFPDFKADSGKIAYVTNMDVFLAAGKKFDGGFMNYLNDNPLCYNLDSTSKDGWMFYGGPGGDNGACTAE